MTMPSYQYCDECTNDMPAQLLYMVYEGHFHIRVFLAAPPGKKLSFIAHAIYLQAAKLDNKVPACITLFSLM